MEAGRFLIWSVLALAGCIAVWFFNLRGPLWIDETTSYWQIAAGVQQIWARQGGSFPAYSYFLWLCTKILGTSEIALRVPSVLAMLAAALFFYRCARELFSKDVALMATTIFCIHPIVVFAASDARPYAFAVLAVNATVLALLLWMRTRKIGHAVWFGIGCACILYFHYLFAAIFPAFALIVLAAARQSRGAALRKQSLVAISCFALVVLPTIGGVLYLSRTSSSHVSTSAPNLFELVSTLVPGYLTLLLICAVLLAIAEPGARLQETDNAPTARRFSLLLAFVPLLILYAISAWTPIHIFIPRYRLVAVPGIALCWGYLASRVSSAAFRLAFFASVAAMILGNFASTDAGYREFTWKYAIDAANRATAADHAPVLISSGLVESNFEPMPFQDVTDSAFFAPLSYYHLNSPVVPLPRDFNDKAKAQTTRFLATAAPRRQRFLLILNTYSKHTADYVSALTKGSYVSRSLGVFNGLAVIEYHAP